MNDAEFTMLAAILQTMLGVFFWPLLIAIIALTVLFVLLLFKERQINSRRLLWAQVCGFFGGWLALWLMAVLSRSRFSDAGGPIDWLIISAVYLIGFIGTAIFYYTLSGWSRSACRCRKTAPVTQQTS